MMKLREISGDAITQAVRKLCETAAFELPSDVETCLKECAMHERNEIAKDFFAQYLENADIARRERLPICQDTGFAVFFVELGNEVCITGSLLDEAVNRGVALGYPENYLRSSIVNDPLFARKNTGNNTPAVIHLTIVKGDHLKIILAPKGGGSENMSAIKMLTPSAGRQGIVDFVVETLQKAGGNPCPPTIVGVGIGGNFEKVAYLAKKALLRQVGSINPDPDYARLEAELLTKINALNIGSQGLGGDITSLAVHIEHHPCHIASLPVAVNLNCHAARHAEVIL